jgi:hypothetical protein
VQFNGKESVLIFKYYIKSCTYRITGKIDIDWSQTLRKKARGIDDCDLGRVQEVNQDHVVTKKGLVSTDEFLLPKALLDKDDGDCLIFKIGKKDAQLFMKGV